jgi:hypothetical protein
MRQDKDILDGPRAENNRFGLPPIRAARTLFEAAVKACLQKIMEMPSRT